MPDIIYAFDLDGGVTTISAESPEGGKWLGSPFVVIPNIDLPAYLVNVRASGLRIASLTSCYAGH